MLCAVRRPTFSIQVYVITSTWAHPLQHKRARTHNDTRRWPVMDWWRRRRLKQRCDSHVSRWYINGFECACVCVCASIHDRPADRGKNLRTTEKWSVWIWLLAICYARPQSVSYQMSYLCLSLCPVTDRPMDVVIDDAVAHIICLFRFFDISDVFPQRRRRRRDKEIKMYTKKNWHRGEWRQPHPFIVHLQIKS